MILTYFQWQIIYMKIYQNIFLILIILIAQNNLIL